MTTFQLQVESVFLVIVMAVLAICMLFCLIRTLIGPRVSDRIVGVNMISTLVIGFIAILSVFLNESGLADISLLYALLSFLAVVIITRIYISIYTSRHHMNQSGKERKKGVDRS